MQIPLANIHWRFLLVRDDWGFQVNPLCRHDITSPFPPSGNEGYVRNRDVIAVFEGKVYTIHLIDDNSYIFCMMYADSSLQL